MLMVRAPASKEFWSARMSHQCLDEKEPSASVKIMIGTWAKYAHHIPTPSNLKEVGAYLRNAAASLALTIDTPRLYVEMPFASQIQNVREGLDATMRLRQWWGSNHKTLDDWSRTVQSVGSDG
jgi:hypothetical protein